MAVITKQQLEDASLDAIALGAVVNGGPTDPDVVTRLGAVVPTLAKMVAAIQVEEESASASAAIATTKAAETVAAAATVSAYAATPAPLGYYFGVLDGSEARRMSFGVSDGTAIFDGAAVPSGAVVAGSIYSKKAKLLTLNGYTLADFLPTVAQSISAKTTIGVPAFSVLDVTKAIKSPFLVKPDGTVQPANIDPVKLSGFKATAFYRKTIGRDRAKGGGRFRAEFVFTPGIGQSNCEASAVLVTGSLQQIYDGLGMSPKTLSAISPFVLNGSTVGGQSVLVSNGEWPGLGYASNLRQQIIAEHGLTTADHTYRSIMVNMAYGGTTILQRSKGPTAPGGITNSYAGTIAAFTKAFTDAQAGTLLGTTGPRSLKCLTALNVDGETDATGNVTPSGLQSYTSLVGGSGGTNGTFALVIPAPPAGGVQAVGTFTVGGGAVNGIQITTAGSGYIGNVPITNAAFVASAGVTGASATLLPGYKGAMRQRMADYATDIRAINNQVENPVELFMQCLTNQNKLTGNIKTGSLAGGTGGTNGTFALVIPAPGTGQVGASQATAVGTFTVAGGSVTAITITNKGAGYLAEVALTNAAFVNSAGITGASLTLEMETITMPIATAQRELDAESLQHKLVGPYYQHWYTRDYQHYNGFGSRAVGALMAAAAKAIWVDSSGVQADLSRWKCLQPTSAERSGKTVRLRFDNAQGPLKFATTPWFGLEPTYGFDLVDSSGNPLAISGVPILTGLHEVLIVATANIPAGAKVRYGFNTMTTRTDYYAGGGGNLRDSQGDWLQDEGTPLHNWCIAFSETLA